MNCFKPGLNRFRALWTSDPRGDAARRKAARRHRPSLDMLEAREVLSTMILTVTNDTDNNPKTFNTSLRGVIQQADAVPAGTNVVIDFNVDGGGFATIQPLTPLPAITRPVTIDGTSEPLTLGGSQTGTAPFVQIDGAAVAANGYSGTNGLTFTSGASGSVVKGLQITGFGGTGLVFSNASNVLLTNDDVGVLVTSQFGGQKVVAHPNTVGVEFDGGSHDTVSQVTIAANSLDGLRLNGTTSDTVNGSFLGTDPTGTLRTDGNGISLGNGGQAHYGTGLYIYNGAQSTSVTGNVISNNGTYGVLLSGPGTSSNTLTSNKIGTDIKGSFALPNVTGVEIANGAGYNQVGLIDTNFWDGGNVISGNSWDGVQISGSGSIENIVADNRIGTNLYDNYAIANWNGIQLNAGASYSFVYANTVSGNSSDGIFVGDSSTYYNDIQNNTIGSDIFGNALGNGQYGIILVSGTWGNTVYANNVQFSGAWGLATFGAGGGNTYTYNNVVNNYGGNILWD